MSRRPLTVAAGVLAAALASAPAVADSFTPVRMTIDVAAVARLHVALPITVRVSADAGALDDRSAPLRVRVKLAQECGGTYAYTPGAVLVDQRLDPQPATGQPYSGQVKGSGRPGQYGVLTVCAWVEEEGDDRVFKSDQSLQVNVSRSCTVAAARYDVLRRKRHSSKRRVAAAKRAARRACGPGVSL